MSFKKVTQYVGDRLSLFAGIGIIISIHWGWYRLQQVPYLVDQSKKEEFPILGAVKVFYSKLLNTKESNIEELKSE